MLMASCLLSLPVSNSYLHERFPVLRRVAGKAEALSVRVSFVRPKASFDRSGVGRLSDFSLRTNYFEFSGLKMSAREGLAKRARDPQIVKDETVDTVKKTRNFVRTQISKPGVQSLIVAVAIPLILGSIDGFVNSPSSQWFADLKKPWWEPPGFIFGGAWGLLYPVMGLASWLVWAEGGFQSQGKALGLYALQLFLNLLWPAFFFGQKNLSLSMIDITALALVLAATIRSFRPVNAVAANLMKPYLAWVLFAAALNLNLWLNNRGDSPKVVEAAE